jgi:Raf kinase inhibitor-like YbhB/YbcL family protein
MKELSIKSSAFENNKLIPSKYTCDGEDTSPPLTVAAIPDGTKSLALILDDPDAPMGTWVHWVVWNIPPINKIDAHTVPGIEGINSFRKHSYGGPCPPSGTHRYFFKVYGLDTKLNLNPNSMKEDLEKAMQGKILAEGQLIGLYRRTR